MTRRKEIKTDQNGNTIMHSDLRTQKQTHPLFLWCFTLKTGQDQLDQIDLKRLWDSLMSFCKKFTFQLEKGDETGFLHYQGVISLKHKERFATVKNLLGDIAHIEPCKNYSASTKYCSKAETRIAGPWTEQSTWVVVPELTRPWQVKLKNILSLIPDNRSILWIWEEQGGVGKTMFAKHMAVREKAIVVTSGSSKDVSYMIDDPKIIIFDFPRVNIERVNYGLIECLKNGLITSPKYETSTKIFNCPHIVCFANSPPVVENMSRDRWLIYKIFDDDLFKDENNYFDVDPNLDIYNASLCPPSVVLRRPRRGDTVFPVE